MEMLFDKTITVLSRALDYHARRHTAIAANIANVDTPGYRAREVVFEKELAFQMNGTKTDRNGSATNAVTREQPSIRVVETDKPVNIDREMSNLAENAIRYNLGVELLSRKLRSIRDFVREVR